jgi:hypothetical protein
VLFGIVAALFLVGFAPSAWTLKRRGVARRGQVHVDDLIENDYDDDDYVEFILRREPDIGPAPGAPISPAYQQESDPVDSWHSPLDEPAPRGQPIDFAHNGSHADSERRFRRIAEYAPRPFGSARPDDRPYRLGEGEAPRGRRYRSAPDDDPTSHGRHSSGR